MIKVLVAAVSSMVLGFVWYSPLLFSKPWMKLSGITKESMKKDQKNGSMNKTYAISTLISIVMAFVLNRLFNIVGINSVYSGVMMALWIGVGFIATTMITTVLYDKKPWTLYFINVGYQLVSLVLMAVVLVVL